MSHNVVDNSGFGKYNIPTAVKARPPRMLFQI